jgi:hypothetical protein
LNHHELRFKRGTRWLLILLAVWIGLMVLCALLPQAIWKSQLAAPIFGVVVSALFAAIAALSAVNFVAYIRWTGRYPFYFLFKRSRTRGDRGANSIHDE